MTASGEAVSGTEAAALAIHRFGLGPAGESITAIAADPRGALLAELERPNAARLDAANLPSSAQAAREVFDFRAAQTAKQKLALRVQKEAETGAEAQAMIELAKVPGLADGPPPAATAVAATDRLERSESALRCRDRRQYWICRAAGLVLVKPFLRLRRQRSGNGRCL
jgi:uncharacterized protein (DUF1800 family)